MTRDEGIKLLKGGKEGVAEWNRRRVAGEDIPELSGANVSGANVSGARRRCSNAILMICRSGDDASSSVSRAWATASADPIATTAQMANGANRAPSQTNA